MQIDAHFHPLLLCELQDLSSSRQTIGGARSPVRFFAEEQIKEQQSNLKWWKTWCISGIYVCCMYSFQGGYWPSQIWWFYLPQFSTSLGEQKHQWKLKSHGRHGCVHVMISKQSFHCILLDLAFIDRETFLLQPNINTASFCFFITGICWSVDWGGWKHIHRTGTQIPASSLRCSFHIVVCNEVQQTAYFKILVFQLTPATASFVLSSIGLGIILSSLM